LDTIPKARLEKLDIFSGDIRDPHGVSKACEKVDVIFHLAALIGIPFSYHSPDCYVDTNIKGTLNVLQAARSHRVKRVVHTSTSEVYGTAQYVPIDEKHPVNPQSPYAATKSAADDLAMSFYKSFDLPVTILRPFNTFGPRQSARAIIPTILSQIYSKQKIIKLGNLNATRDLNYITNTVDAFIALAQNDKCVGKVFNTGSSKEISVGELTRLIMEITKKKLKIETVSQRFRPKKSEVERLLCDYHRIQDVCGWKPKVSLERGLELTCQWVKNNLNKYKSEIYNV